MINTTDNNQEYFEQINKEKHIINSDIYSSGEKLSFNQRHPIFRTLIKLEFEKAVRDYLRKS